MPGSVRRVLTVALALGAPAVPGGSRAAAGELPPARPSASDLAGVFDEARTAARILGLAWAVVRDDAIVSQGGSGVEAVGGAEKVDEGTAFAVASLTKAFTSAAVAILVDEGRAAQRPQVRADRAALARVTIVTRDCYHDVMKTVTIRDLRTRPRQVRDALRREREAVLTANGSPVAVLIPVDAGSVDETLETLRRARGIEALRAIRRESRGRGLDRLSASEIEAIITRARRARTAPRK